MLLVYHLLRHSLGVASVSRYRGAFSLLSVIPVFSTFQRKRNKNQTTKQGGGTGITSTTRAPSFREMETHGNTGICFAIFRELDFPYTTSTSILE
jgi:hypothetical protein